ncbi:MAG: hypothetical protein K1V83_09255, partial [Prevotella sp.]
HVPEIILDRSKIFSGSIQKLLRHVPKIRLALRLATFEGIFAHPEHADFSFAHRNILYDSTLISARTSLRYFSPHALVFSNIARIEIHAKSR